MGRAAVRAPFFMWIAAAALFMLFYTLTASSPMLGEVTWKDAARLGTAWWLTSWGGHAAAEGVAISLVPLTFTLIAIAASYRNLRNREIRNWAEVAAAAIGQTATVTVIGLVMRPAGPWWPAILVSFVLGLLTAALAGRELLLNAPWLTGLLSGTKRRWWWFASLAATLTLLALIVAMLAGWHRVALVNSYYLTGALGTIGLILLQLAYLPNFFVWTFAWLTGAGFGVGQGSWFSVLGNHSEPLPAIPILGALPRGGGKGYLLAILIVLFLLLAIGHTLREGQEVGLLTALRRAAVSAVGFGVVVAVAGLGASGALGPGRMAEIGPNPPALFGVTLLVTGLPYLMGTLLAHPATRSWVRSLRRNKAENEPDRGVKVERISDDDAFEPGTNQPKTEAKEEE